MNTVKLIAFDGPTVGHRWRDCLVEVDARLVRTDQLSLLEEWLASFVYTRMDGASTVSIVNLRPQ